MNKIHRSALVVFWIFSFLIPLAYIPRSYDSVSVKLFLFSAMSGILLILSGFGISRDRRFPTGSFMIAGAAAITVAVFNIYPGSGTGCSRTIQLLSAAALFISLGVFRFEPRQILMPVAAGGILALSYSLLFPGNGYRLAGSFGNPNLASAFAAGLLPAGSFLFRKNRWQAAAGFVIMAFVCIAVITGSGTRSSVIALPAGTGAILLLKWKKQLLVPLAVLFTVCSIFLLFNSLPRFEGTMGSRQCIWEGTAEMIAEKPLIGWGTGSFQPVFPLFRDPEFARMGLPSNTVHAHSEVGELLAENGAFGLLLWGAFWVMFFRKSVKDVSSQTVYAALAGIAVSLVESSVSVALRWTSQVFLVAALAAAASRWKSAKVPRLTALPVAAGGFLLLLYGGGTALREAESYTLLYRALELQNEGAPTDQVIDLCQRSIELNGREPAVWFIMGNQYGIEAESRSSSERKTYFIQMQLAAYDSLEKRVTDYAWAVQNRAAACFTLGRWDSGLDQIAGILETRYHLKSWAIENGIVTVPLAGDAAALEFSGRIYAMLLSSSGEDSSSAERLLSCLGTVYAVSAVRAPETIPVLDAICRRALENCDPAFTADVMNRMAREAETAPKDLEALDDYLHGIPCEWPVTEENLYSPYRVALLCRMAADSGRGEYLETALCHADLLHENCYFLGSRFPGGEFAFTSPGEISATMGGSIHAEVMDLCLRYILEMNSYEERVRVRNLRSLNPTENPWILKISPDELPGVPGELPMEFLVSLQFTQAAAEAALPGSDREAVTRRFLDFAGELEKQLGPETADEMLTTVTSAEIHYLENGPFSPAISASARMLREALRR